MLHMALLAEETVKSADERPKTSRAHVIGTVIGKNVQSPNTDGDIFVAVVMGTIETSSCERRVSFEIRNSASNH